MNRNRTEKTAELRERLRVALDEIGMRPVDLSAKTGIPKSMVSYYLSGKSKPKSDRLYEISKVLNVSEAWLMGYDVPKGRTQTQQKNDALVDVIKQLRVDPDFFDVVSQLAELPAEEYGSIKLLISSLRKK